MDPSTPALAQAKARNFDEVVIEFHREDVGDHLMILKFMGVPIEARTLGLENHPLRESLTVR